MNPCCLILMFVTITDDSMPSAREKMSKSVIYSFDLLLTEMMTEQRAIDSFVFDEGTDLVGSVHKK